MKSWNKEQTRTGCILYNKDKTLECLYVGDYGKSENIKADFLGYDKRIDFVKHHDVDLNDKLVMTVSTQKGCPMNCKFCDCPFVGFKGSCSFDGFKEQIDIILSTSGLKNVNRLNLHYARMGEPSFNPAVLDFTKAFKSLYKDKIIFNEFHPVVSTMLPRNNKNLHQFLIDWCYIKNNLLKGDAGLQFSINTLDEDKRNKMFSDMSLSLNDISALAKELPYPIGRKYTLNFAVTRESNLDVEKMDLLFDKNKFIIKITPIHATVSAKDNSFEIVSDFDVYSKFEEPLVKDGWDVIVFVPSFEEDADRITCGNALLRNE